MRLRLPTVLLAVTVLTVTTAASCGGDEPSITLAAAGRAAVAEEIDAHPGRGGTAAVRRGGPGATGRYGRCSAACAT
ncbi:hypothetical protein [Verrucosispora sioxanthis]|uniref:hypothetical protein n=1 Tax=Verrucosispora sioxanthis TaxID=2499994 RepID=UPI0020A0E6CE|nr:hypothetical protein [Verrucosispora sioxanthis]